MKSIVGVLLIAAASLNAGTLPELNEKPWVGWFAGSKNRDFYFGVKNDGEGAFVLADRNGEMGSSRLTLVFQPVIEEVLPSGRVVTKETLIDGWEPITEASEQAELISYRGTVTGGARFEVHFEIEKGEIRGGGRILEKGELTENPIRFSLRIRFPNTYPYQRDEEQIEDEASDDRIQFERADEKKLKFDAWEPVWAEKEDVSGPGVQRARIELSTYDGGRFELEAGEQGLFEFYNGSLRPLYKGFTFGWKPDPEKDPEGTGRFVFEFKP
ncbi:MAG: hypothetical protein ACQKBU_03135 [Verrucomicrobiales bacterium]